MKHLDAFACFQCWLAFECLAQAWLGPFTQLAQLLDRLLSHGERIAVDIGSGPGVTAASLAVASGWPRSS
jgi:hypothetical protein